MHLLAAAPGSADEGQPVDPGQSPADLVFLSAADSELAMLAEARAGMADPPTLRLLNLSWLRHPISVDLHLDACATRSRLVVARFLGGAGYWRHAFTQYSARLAEAGVPFAALPGDDRPDPELQQFSTVAPADYAALWSALVEGGPENAVTFLAHARAILDGADRPAAARPLLKAGFYWPGEAATDQATLTRHWTPGQPVVPILFYRALMQGGGLHPIDQLVKALVRRGLNPCPVFVASLKDPLSVATLTALFQEHPPTVILNTTAFAAGSLHGDGGANPLAGPAANGAVVLQVVLSGGTEEAWREGLQGLSPRDVAMNVALPEVDGRILSRAISFKAEAREDPATECRLVTYRAVGDRVGFVADLAAAWARLRVTPVPERRIALVLANYPNRDGRLANGVGLDTPAATAQVLDLLGRAGYRVEGAPDDAAALMARLLAGPTNWLADRADRTGGEVLRLDDYRSWFSALPWETRHAVESRWGPPETDPFLTPEGFRLSVHRFGQVAVGLQPARGYNIDPQATYHAPDLVPPHHYLAFYLWLRQQFGVHALVHMGKHGNLEWLPGKALALSSGCWPEVALGPVPHVYPFIVNDPGEGSQAKRRASAVIVDHLTPPMTRAETYGPLRDLEALVDEHAEAQMTDPRRAAALRAEIASLAEATGIAADAGLSAPDDLSRLDAWLCEIKESQIRDGLHVFGVSPTGRQARDLALALLRLPRGDGQGAGASLLRALAADLDLTGLDPLDCPMAADWAGPRPGVLQGQSDQPWRTQGDTVERLELLAQDLLEGADPPGPASATVLDWANDHLRPVIAACGPAEAAGLLTALDGRFVPPGPSGAPTRGRPDVLPTGRNFYSVDTRAVPTPSAWALGWKSANLLIEAHLQREGDWPRALLLTAWGTANMRTGGDDIAMALALMGVRPTWDAMNRRVTGFEVLPAGVLGRPRVDVTLRVSGFFRDAFPGQIALIDAAARAVMALDEPDAQNPAAAAARAEGGPTPRIYGAKPGAYGAGLQAMIDERLWSDRADLGQVWLDWGGYAYTGEAEGRPDRAGLVRRIGSVEGIVQNQDNREHDLLDSDDYYQFEGGAAAAVAAVQGRDRTVWHNDHSRPERPVIRTLTDEVARVMRARVVNPKWIEGVRRHGYKGAFEIAATVDYLFAFAATTRAVQNHHFDLVHGAFLDDPEVRAFLAEANPAALREIAQRLAEAIDRGLWMPRSNSARALIDRLTGLPDR